MVIKYKVCFIPEAKRHYHDRFGNTWLFLSDAEIQTLFPNGGFKIFSDLDIHKNKQSQHILVNESAEIGVYPYQKKLAWMKRTIGYIPSINESKEIGFIRIIGMAWYRPLLILLAILMSASIFLIGMWYAKKDEVAGLDQTAVAYHIEGVKNTDEDSILLPGISVLNGKVNDRHIKAVLMNPDGNSCYFKYSIQRKDTKTILYISGLIGPGKAVTEFNLNQALPIGKYPIRVKVETHDLKDPDIVYNAGNIDAELFIAE